MTLQEQYQRKLVSAEEAVKVVKSRDQIDFSSFNGQPALLDQALAARKDELTNVHIRGASSQRPVACVEADPERKHFIYSSWHMSAYERRLHDKNLCNFNPVAFHERSHPGARNNRHPAPLVGAQNLHRIRHGRSEGGLHLAAC